MAAALRSSDFFDLFEVEDKSSRLTDSQRGFFWEVENVDASNSTATSTADELVYTPASTTDSISIMSAFRKDLFVSITLPILIAAVGASALGWGAYTHLDTKLDAAKTEASSGVDHLGDMLRTELRADRDARAKEFEVIRVEMREDRKETRDAFKELIKKS